MAAAADPSADSDHQDFTFEDVTVTDEGVVRRAVAAASIGNFTEWYDFGVYSYLTAIIAKVFFATCRRDWPRWARSPCRP